MTTWIDWMEEEGKSNFLSYFLLEAMSGHGNGSLDEFRNEDGKFNSGAIKVELKINDVPVDIRGLCNKLDAQRKEYADNALKSCSEAVLNDIRWKIDGVFASELEEE